MAGIVYKFLPFKARIKPLNAASIELFSLADEAEKGWYDVAEGELTGSKVNEMRFKIRSKKSAIMKASFTGISLPEDKDLMREAEAKMRAYFSNFYTGADDE